jgi:hypothetical protein
MAKETRVEEMTNFLEDEEAAIIVELEKLGANEVRQRLATNQFNMVYNEPARRWIDAIDRASDAESERRKNASMEEQIRIARSAKNAAWAAAIAAIIAAIIATTGAFISYLAWSRPHPEPRILAAPPFSADSPSGRLSI